jgi:flagellar basal body-associated protein FliL
MILIRFLIITICVLYIVRSLARIFLPMLFQSVVNKAQQQHQQQYRQQQQQQYKRPEEKIRVDYVPPAKKSSVPDNEGDFIDYEEVK